MEITAAISDDFENLPLAAGQLPAGHVMNSQISLPFNDVLNRALMQIEIAFSLRNVPIPV